MNESLAYLWHKYLGHISKARIEGLIKSEILPDLDFFDLNICIDCIKGKQIKHINKKWAIRSTSPYDVLSFGG